MAKKILILVIVLIICFWLLIGCVGNKYNAELYYNAQAMMNVEYLKDNMTLWAEDDFVIDTSLPETRTHIIKNENDFNFAFNEFPKEVDFSKKMVLIYFFTSCYPTSPYRLKKITIDSDILYVDFQLNKVFSLGRPDASKPQQTCVVLFIDILDINSVRFKQV